MSYSIVKTIEVAARQRLIESEQVDLPLSALIGKNVYFLLEQNGFYHVLSLNNMLTYEQNVNLLSSFSDNFYSKLSDLFISKYSNSQIPFKNGNDLYRKRLIVFDPISSNNCSVHFTSVNTPTILDDVNKRGYLDDLVIIPQSSYDFSNCLVAVNGVFHRTVFTNNFLYVLDAQRTMRLSGRRDVVVVDTSAVGGHTIVPLTPANVTQPAYQQAATVTLNQSIANKTVFAVIDGYFYHRDQNVLKIADATHLKIGCNKLPLIQQFRHNPRTVRRVDLYGPDATQTSRQYNDPYESVFLNNPVVATTQLANSDFQYSRLTHFHSFLVVMNNPNLYTVSHAVSPTGTPQLYQDQASLALSGMANYGCGLCPSYLIWRDPRGGKSVFLPEQDYDVDLTDHSINPLGIPDLIVDPIKGAKLPLRFIDYVSA